MKRWQKRVSIIVGAVVGLFLVVCYLLMFYPQLFMGYDLDDKNVRSNREEIVKKIEDYIALFDKLPASLSELGFEQTPGLYCYKGNSLNLIKTGWHSKNEYILEVWDRSHKIWQYSSEDMKWYDDELFEFEPPLNIDTIRGIYGAYYSPRENMQIKVDSLKINDYIVLLLDQDGEIKGDSLAYLRFLSNDTLKMEGWVVFRSHQLPEYLKEFGAWKYYDKDGNCYRKFWNYKDNGKLIYEPDR